MYCNTPAYTPTFIHVLHFYCLALQCICLNMSSYGLDRHTLSELEQIRPEWRVRGARPIRRLSVSWRSLPLDHVELENFMFSLSISQFKLYQHPLSENRADTSISTSLTGASDKETHRVMTEFPPLTMLLYYIYIFIFYSLNKRLWQLDRHPLSEFGQIRPQGRVRLARTLRRFIVSWRNLPLCFVVWRTGRSQPWLGSLWPPLDCGEEDGAQKF